MLLLPHVVGDLHCFQKNNGEIAFSAHTLDLSALGAEEVDELPLDLAPGLHHVFACARDTLGLHTRRRACGWWTGRESNSEASVLTGRRGSRRTNVRPNKGRRYP